MRRDGKAARLRRIVVAGGAGFFGRNVVELLRAEGLRPLIAGRSGDIVLDLEEGPSLRAGLRPGDVIVDAAGPFQTRTTGLVETAIEIGADVVDLNEGLAYAKRVALLDGRARERGVAVLSSCSAVSTVAAVLLRLSGVDRPRRVSALVAPASRETAHEGTIRALLASVGRPIEVRREGRSARAIGWRETHAFALPRRRGYLVESALSLTLPEVWPTLRSVDCWTDTRTFGANTLLSLVARSDALHALAENAVALGALGARFVGARDGAFALEVEDEAGRVRRLALTSERRSYLIAAAPAALAARALAEGRFTERGVVPPDRHVPADELIPYLGRLGIRLQRE
ncbi:MAG: hypothetical protein ACRDGT_10140 [Candidatus Limnocylindria bacterium]